MRALLAADVIICTPEKWDGISRNWQNRTYVKKVALLVIDEIHLLGADRYSPKHMTPRSAGGPLALQLWSLVLCDVLLCRMP